MIKITSKNETTAQLIASQNIISQIAESLQFRPEGYFFMPSYKSGRWDGFIKPVDFYGNFQKGLLSEIRNQLTLMDLEYEIEEEHFPELANDNIALCDTENITNEKGELITPFDYQIFATETVLNKKRCIIQASTGAGKSLLQYLIIKSLLDTADYKKVLLIVPTVTLVSQMYGDFGDYSLNDDSFDVESNCHMISAGKEKESKKPVIISTWQSLHTIKDPEFFMQFDCVLCDEVQTATSTSITNIVNKCINAKIKAGFSGTVQKTKTHLTTLKGLFGDVIKVTSTKDLMEKDILTNLDIKSVVLKHKADIPKLEYKDELSYLCGHQGRNKFICKLACQQEGNTLILFQLVEKHGKPLLKMMQEMYPEKDIFFINGSVKASDREDVRKKVENCDSAIILASYQTFQAGVNIKKLHNVIFASPSKSEVRVFQSIGRALRKHKTKDVAKLFDIADDLRGNKKQLNHTLRHFKDRIEMYYREGFKVKYLELDL